MLDRRTVTRMCSQQEHNARVPEHLRQIARVYRFFFSPLQTERQRAIVRGLPPESSFTSSGYEQIGVGGHVGTCEDMCVCACAWVRVDCAVFVERVGWFHDCLMPTDMFTWGAAKLIKCR